MYMRLINYSFNITTKFCNLKESDKIINSCHWVSKTRKTSKFYGFEFLNIAEVLEKSNYNLFPFRWNVACGTPVSWFFLNFDLERVARGTPVSLGKFSFYQETIRGYLSWFRRMCFRMYVKKNISEKWWCDRGVRLSYCASRRAITKYEGNPQKIVGNLTMNYKDLSSGNSS